MRYITAILLFTYLSGAAQSDHGTDLLKLADAYKSLDEDSLDLIVDRILGQADKTENQELRQAALLKKAESLILFNHFSEADSVIDYLVIDSLSEKLHVEFLLARGKILNKRNENDAALDAYYVGLELCQQVGYEKLIPEFYTEIGILLRQNNDVENTLKYFKYALEEAEKQGNSKLMIRVYILLCKVYNGWLILDLDSSVYYGEKGVHLAQATNDEHEYADAISIVSAPIIRKGESRRGLEMSKEALGFADKYNFTMINRYYLLANLGFAYKDLKMYDSALYYMKQAGELRPESLDYPRLQYQVFKARGDYKEALSALELYWQKLDSTLRSRNKTKLSSLQARLDSNLKEQEVISLKQAARLQELQIAQQRYLFLGVTFFLLLFGGGASMLYRQKQLKQKQRLTKMELEETHRRLELEQQYRASELKAIRSQMNPHFVFNALNSIQDYIMSNERKLAGKYLGKFADLMRMYLEHSQVKIISIGEELKALKLYLELEKLRFETSLKYEIHLGETLDQEMQIPSLLIQPYVENALKHGLLHKKDDRRLLISMMKDEVNNVLECRIVDNGIGRERSKEINEMRNPFHKSFATRATRSRLDLLNFDRNSPIKDEIIDLKDEGGRGIGTEAIIRIPLIDELETEIDHSEVSTKH